MWTTNTPSVSWQQPLLAAFTKQTGIKVTYEAEPEGPMTEKLPAAQEAKDSSYALFQWAQSETSNYTALKAVAPIGSYLKNKTLTPASFDLAGIPTGTYGQCTLNGVVYCLPTFNDAGPELFYNKSMFRAAGLTPPTNWAQVVADANKLNTPAHAGMCMRGSEASGNGYAILLMIPYFLPWSLKYQGEYLNADWKPLWDLPQALPMFNDYSDVDAE